MVIKPKHIRIISTALAVALALPFQWKALTGFYNWFSPFIFLNSLLILKSLVALNVLGISVLLISLWKKRWFCTHMCPLGFACDKVSEISPRKSAYLKKVPALGRWIFLTSLVAAVFGISLFILLDPMAIFNGFFAVFTKPFSWLVLLSFLGLPLLLGAHLIFPNLWCIKICPLGGLFDDIWLIRNLVVKNQEKSKTTFSTTSRRYFLAGTGGILAGIFIPNLLKPSDKKKFKPPASLNDPLFSTLCVRCGSCIKACPGDILKHDSYNGILSWMTPELTFDRGGYCHETCNLCGTVCPSGAISPFSVKAKKNLFIATAEIGLLKCLLTHQTECDRCKAVCTYKAINIIPTEVPLIMEPKIETNLCVGCGACALVCPEETIKMVPLTSL